MNDSATDAYSACPECGARLTDGLACWEQLGYLIAWEATDPALRAEHFLLVASYNLQHPAQFTDDALSNLRAGFVDRLDSGVAVSELRRRASRQFEGKTRVLRPASERMPVRRAWALTIDSVYLPDQPEGAADRVRSWAEAIRRELP